MSPNPPPLTRPRCRADLVDRCGQIVDIIKPVFPVIVPYIAAGMVRSVMYGMAWAMQEFAWIAFFEGISTCVYIPLCLYAKYGTCHDCQIT